MSVLIAGDNSFKQISATNSDAINHPQAINIDLSEVISYSIYRSFAIIVLNSGIPCAIGSNQGWPIHESLPRIIKEWTSFNITDDERNDYFVESAVCGSIYTLYKLRLATPNSESRLALVKKGKLKGKPLFLNTGNWIPMSLYGGKDICAAIDEKGAIHVINNSITSTSDYSTKVLLLPNNELPISVCFCNDLIFALSGQKIVYEFRLSDFDQNKNQFQKTAEFNRISICSISGVSNHCIAVSLQGDVFVRGSNEDGQLGVGKDIKETKQFVQLTSLKGQKIKNAFAGSFHSLFLDENGKIFSCGGNKSGELLIENRIGQKIYQPIMTTIKSKARFCISGFHISVAFVDCLPPPNSPNQTLRLKSPYPFPHLFESNSQSEPADSNEKLLEEIRKLKQTILEQSEANELLHEIVTTQIGEFTRLNKENEKMKKILQSSHIEVDFESDDSDANTENSSTNNNDNDNNNNNNNDDFKTTKNKETKFINSGSKNSKKESVDYKNDDDDEDDDNDNYKDYKSGTKNYEKKKKEDINNSVSKVEKSENLEKNVINKTKNERSNESSKSIYKHDDFDYDYIDEEEEVKDENDENKTEIDSKIVIDEEEEVKDENDNKNFIIYNDDDDDDEDNDYDDNPEDFSD